MANAFWPGPLTLVLNKAEHVPDIVTAGAGTIALRIPAHEGTLALLRTSGLPIAAPSANRFTELSPTTAQHVADGLGDRVGLILDGGPCAVGVESTVVDLTAVQPIVLRPGHITPEQIAQVLREPVLKRSPHASASPAHPHASPGLSARHYAPATPVWLASETDAQEVARALSSGGAPLRFALLALEQGLQLPGAFIERRLARDPAAYARGLYAALHELDRAGCQLLVVERPPKGSQWDAVHDRLIRGTRESD